MPESVFPALDRICLGRCRRPIDLEYLARVDQVRIVNPVDGCKVLVSCAILGRDPGQRLATLDGMCFGCGSGAGVGLGVLGLVDTP